MIRLVRFTCAHVTKQLSVSKTNGFFDFNSGELALFSQSLLEKSNVSGMYFGMLCLLGLHGRQPWKGDQSHANYSEDTRSAQTSIEHTTQQWQQLK